MMTAHASRSGRKRSSEDDSGFTLVEVVVAIPIVLLVLGIVFSSIGVSIGLMGQVTQGAGAARVASVAMDQLSAARNCAEVGSIINTLSASDYDSSYLVNFPSFTSTTCKENTPFALSIEIKDPQSNATYYSDTLNILAV